MYNCSDKVLMENLCYSSLGTFVLGLLVAVDNLMIRGGLRSKYYGITLKLKM